VTLPTGNQWRSQPKIFWGAKKFGLAKMFDFRPVVFNLFCKIVPLQALFLKIAPFL